EAHTAGWVVVEDEVHAGVAELAHPVEQDDRRVSLHAPSLPRGAQGQRRVEALAVAQQVVGDAVADLAGEAHVGQELSARHLQRLAPDADDDVVLAYPRLTGRLTDELALAKSEASRRQPHSLLLRGGQVVAVDTRRRVQAAQRPAPRDVR